MQRILVIVMLGEKARGGKNVRYPVILTLSGGRGCCRARAPTTQDSKQPGTCNQQWDLLATQDSLYPSYGRLNLV